MANSQLLHFLSCDSSLSGMLQNSLNHLKPSGRVLRRHLSDRLTRVRVHFNCSCRHRLGVSIPRSIMFSQSVKKELNAVLSILSNWLHLLISYT